MNIWWNHWFSTAYHLIDLMRKSYQGLHMIGSNSNPDCVYRMVCDEFYIEPCYADAGEYISYCIEFCKHHKIDVFVPRHYLTEIIKHKNEFNENNTLLLANTDVESVSLTNNKISAYQYLQSNGMGNVVPEFYACGNIVDFESAVQKLQSDGHKVCFKLAVDEGAITYHAIEKDKNTSIYKSSSSHISYKESVEIIRNYDFKIPLLVMPYMTGPEISVDCLKTDSEYIIIPRYKLNGRVSEVRFEREIIGITKEIGGKFNFDMPFNIQYRILDGKPMLLELNPRMSGGLQLSWKASEINLPQLALKKLLGEKMIWSYPAYKSRKVAHIETPIIIEMS